MLAVSAQAQVAGSIQGTVTDSTGAAITNCQVTVTNVGTQATRNAACGANGYYVVPQLDPGQYDVTAVAPGFAKLARTSQTLQANQPLTVDLKMKVGAASQTVTVTTAAAQVNTTTATISQVITGASIVGLPLLDRNAATLITLVAGSTIAPNARATQGLSIPDLVTPSVNGSRGNQTSYFLDGALNTDSLTDVNAPFPFPDALQEFSVQTANYSAQYGQTSGAVVNIATKSGTNSLHGDVFEFDRNAVLDAIGYFNVAKPSSKQHQFGATIGGPVVLPFYNGRNRTFFFGGFQKTIIRAKNAASYTFVPTAANDMGDFSSLLSATNPANPTGEAIQLYYPGTTNPIPGNIIDTTTHPLDPVFLNLTKLLQPQTDPDGEVETPSPANQTNNEYVVRIDQMLGSKDNLTGRYYHYGYNKVSPFIPGNFLSMGDPHYIPDDNFMVKETHVFNPNLLNVAQFSWIRINGTEAPPAGIPTYSSLGMKLNQDFKSSGNMGLYAYDWMYAPGAWPVTWDRKSYQYGDDLHLVHGKHSLGFGALVIRSSFNTLNAYNEGPSFDFSGEETGGLQPDGSTLSDGFSLASMALGAVYNFTQAVPSTSNLSQWYIGAYAQDNYHVAQRLTLNLGMRWEPFLPWIATDGKVSHFSPAAYATGTLSTKFPNAPPGISYPGDPGFPNGDAGVGSNKIGFAPRVGFAYDINGNGKSSIRGGFGMFYETSQVAVTNMPFNTNPFTFGVTLDVDQAGPFANPYGGTVADPFPAPPPGPSATFPGNPSVMTYDPFHYKYQTPVNYDWNLTLEQQLTENLLFHVGYIGNHGSHGLETWELNPAVYTPGGDNSTGTNARRLFPGIGNITDLVHDVNSSYNALQVTLQKRVSHGFSILANYTWSKAMDDLPESAAVNSALVPPAIPWYLPNFHRLDYGPSDWDATNIFVASYEWNLPSLSGSNALVRGVLGNWENTGIVSWQSGTPFTVFAGQDVSRTGLNADRAELVPGVDPYGGNACAPSLANGQPCKNWLNPAAFTLPAPGTFGNAQKGAFRRPRSFDYDTGLFKNFSIRQRFNLQFRAEFFNVFNNTNFGIPSAHANANPGAITSATNIPRTGQLAVKIRF
jgi:hypothetical protein